MKVLWSELAEESDGWADATPLSADIEFQNFLLSYARPFMANWQLDVPPIYTIGSRGSCYALDSKAVFLNLHRTDAQAKRANTNLTAARDAEELAALFCLCHELTHAVQHYHYGTDKVLQTRLLMEAHADTVAGYWLSPQLREGVADLVSNIAFQLKHNPALQTHPPGCTRRSCVIKGMSIGSAMLLQDGDLTASISSRPELLTDSISTATTCLFSTPRPCDALSEHWSQLSPELCSTCPKADQTESTN